MTKTIDGTLVSDVCFAKLEAGHLAGRPVFFGRQSGPGCPNCGGFGSVIARVVEAGPFDSVPQTTKPITYVGGKWYIAPIQLHACPMCQTDNTLRISALWDASGLEGHERNWRLDHLVGRAGKELALQYAREWLAATPAPMGWLSLSGDYGRGKSGILKSLVAAFVRAGVPAAYRRAGDILGEVRSSFGDRAENESEIARRYASWQFLAIDEVDRIGDTKWATDRMMTLLDDRYNRRGAVATAIATNQHPERMGSAWQYLVSRMRDGDRVVVGGEDLRGDAEREMTEFAP